VKNGANTLVQDERVGFYTTFQAEFTKDIPSIPLFNRTETHAINVNLASVEAINVPSTIRVYMNSRQPDMRGVIYPVPTTLSTAEGLQDLVLDRCVAGYTPSGAAARSVRHPQAALQGDQVGPSADGAGDRRRNALANTGGNRSASSIERAAVGKGGHPPIRGNAPRARATMAAGLRLPVRHGEPVKLVGNLATLRP
jgi:hypothetical protein